ncbi:putative Phage antitermination Q-like [Vibrio nigripulchritudo SFn27]|uniref:Phage antitermination Q-like n=2 Tax=Vibrio nigripulchritudo TaxID=28173 RepID=A0AAV2VJR3_9VIBR|nr:antiterminator Q family protein [Vibrio nigripulchritudo]CCN38216.1 putative Phage antitermination Q-like [Vibrio nigripulchritudo AM115]CCN42694.1 putative Phage antitermination Q-like [Vibrio nigripulchritudo FTn2]CCN79090.1 putative Phage antitermination Q-like [Vibrio nigripulchritudo SO65]CCN84531.1 putative Phage antitermination Q-like [Vibrio nigripulchritudo BLFn1]CCN88853.1 putative Phage antitermination Q-like [Vibrio nigripulchritudo SFn27]
MAELITHNTPWLLEQWGRWARVNSDLTVGYPSITSFTKLLGSTLPSPLINDDDAMLVDSAVARLNRRDEEMGQAVVLFYTGGSNVSQVARWLDIDRRRADVLVKSGTAWVDAAIDNVA